MARPFRPLPRTRRVGILIAGATAVVSGFAVFINGYGVTAWRDAGVSTATYTTAKNLVAAFLLLGLAAAATAGRRRSRLTRPERPRQWIGLAAVALVGGSVPFLLFFEGLARAEWTQAALLHKSLVVWVALLAVPLLGERLDLPHVGAIGLLVAGQIALVGNIDGLALGTGEWMILGATLLWSIEIIVAKRLLTHLSPLTVGVARMGGGVAILLAYGIATGAFASLGALGASQWGWVLVTGGVLTAYVATWYAALARAQAVDVTAVLVFGAVITALLRTGVQDAALPSTLGIGLVTLGALAAVAATLRGRRPATR